MSDAAFERGFFQLVDVTRVTEVRVDKVTEQRIADSYVFSGKSRRAFLVATTLGYAISRMFMGFHRVTGMEEMQIFKDRNEALKWLGVAPF